MSLRRIFCLFLSILCVPDVSRLEVAATNNQPNIVFLLTDDQDVTANSLDYMPRLHTILRDGGMEYVNYFVPTGLCCPSRSTIISGQFCHNTGIWDNGELNNSTYLSGGLPKMIALGLESVTIATQLKEAGYETYLVGKYVNGYGDNQVSHIPPGWDHWYGMSDPIYYGPHFSVEGQLLKTSNTTYQTDFIGETVLKFLRDRKQDQPFFMYIAPYAPHAPSQPAARHASLFSNISAPRFPSYNPPDSLQLKKPSWLKHLPPLNDVQKGSIDEFYRNRLRALQAVDEMLENITTLLEEQGTLDNTYIFFMGDNGQHLGDYRLPAGKRQGYDTDIRVPFLVRGPGVKKGEKVTEVVMSVDLFPTWLEIANGNIPSGHITDGKSFMSLLHSASTAQPVVNSFRAVALAEMFGGSSNMGLRYKGMPDFERNRFWNNSYQLVRVINGSDWAENADWMYAEWCTGEREFYNMTEDPHQVNNTVDKLDPSLLQKLTLLLNNLAKCAGNSCWKIDFDDIGKQAAQTNLLHLRCFNPPDMPGKLISKTSLMTDDMNNLDVCKSLFHYGFPFADSDIVPDHITKLWQSCYK